VEKPIWAVINPQGMAANSIDQVGYLLSRINENPVDIANIISEFI
jgi:hypothetical protein